MVKSVSITETQFRVGVGIAGLALAAGLATISFCGTVSLPPKSAPPHVPAGTFGDLLTRSSALPAVYQDFIARDAALAGVPVPSIEALSRKLPYRVDDVRHVLEVGEPPIEVAGVRLRAVRIAEGLALEIANATGADIAYDVQTTPIRGGRCHAVAVLPFNAMTIGKDQHQIRVECDWRDGVSLAVTRVETVEVLPLSAWYLNHVPPSAMGIDPRVARGHVPLKNAERCAATLPQAVRSGLERGEISWRDLVDFYARHRCQTYRFPSTYRAFRSDGERAIPAVSAGM